MATTVKTGIRAAQLGLAVNVVLVLVKLAAGIWGMSFALVADAVESSTDIFASLILWSGLSIAARPPDESHPYGHGKAESLATATIALMLLGAAVGITIAAVREILTPHNTPAPFTLAVLAGVVIVKEVLFRTVLRAGQSIESNAVVADAWHHRSDAFTSAAAFIGIAIAIRGGAGWESADDWASLFAAVVIAANGVRFLSAASRELMDGSPNGAILGEVILAARSVEGVLATEKERVRKIGLEYHVDIHVQADPALCCSMSSL